MTGSEFTLAGITAIAAVVLVDVIATASVVARFVNHPITQNRLHRDDVCIIIAWLCSLPMTLNVGMEIHWGFRLDHESSPAQQAADFKSFLLINYIVENFYTASITLTKFAIVFFYLRVFGHVPWMHLSCRIAMGLMAFWGVASIFVGIFQCIPVRRAYDLSVPGSCLDITIFFIVQRATNLITDILLLALPIKAVVNLQISIAKRLSLVFAFATGGLVCFATAYTLALTVSIIGREIRFSDYRSLIWTVVELEIGIFCANSPFLYPLLLRCIPQSWKSKVADGVEGLVRSAAASRGANNTATKQYGTHQSGGTISWVKGGAWNGGDRDRQQYALRDMENRSTNSDVGILGQADGIYVRKDYDVVSAVRPVDEGDHGEYQTYREGDKL